ncbi:MAG: hypothetical protein K6B68_17510 [Eubacterium sp.]|nr:hypothetical protein [Eubacterium sp.]
MSEKYPNHKVLEEGDSSPVELAELRICAELFPDRCTVLPSKKYGEKDIDKFGIEIRRFREEDAN